MAAAEVTPMIPETAGSVEAPETPVVETPEVAAPETPEVVEAQPDTATAPETATPEQDGRQIPPALRQHLANLSAKPETQALAKQIKADFFTVRAYREVFPSPKEAVAAKSFMENVGGEEGLQAIEAERQEWASLDEQFTSGSPEFIKNIAAESPEAFEKLIPHALELFQTQNPEMYEHLMARVLSNTANARGGLSDLVSKAAEAAKTLNNPALSQTLAQIQSWLGYFDEKAQKIPEKKIDPERQKLEQEKAAWETQKQETFRREITSQILTHTQSEIKKQLSAHLKGRAINDDDFGIFHDNVIQQVQKIMLNDKAYLAKGQRYIDAGDREGAIKFQKDKLAALLPDAVSKTYKRFYSIGAGGKTQAPPPPQAGKAPVTPAPQGWVRVQGPPKTDEVDHGKTPMAMKYNSQAILKNGKKVFWGDKVPA